MVGNSFGRAQIFEVLIDESTPAVGDNDAEYLSCLFLGQILEFHKLLESFKFALEEFDRAESTELVNDCQEVRETGGCLDREWPNQV